MSGPAAPHEVSLAALQRDENDCRRCALYREATQAVPGEGEAGATLMLVGEQPGDREDRAGKPFVGPAGRILDRALAEAGIPRGAVFVTNAVKHFKHEMRGKRRLHKRPSAGEIEACRWWLELERELVGPKVIVALGATAAHGVLGRAVAVGRARNSTVALADGTQVRVTIHPSLILRLQTNDEKEFEYRQFVVDLRHAAELAGAPARG